MNIKLGKEGVLIMENTSQKLVFSFKENNSILDIISFQNNFRIDSPGEYEYSGIYVHAIPKEIDEKASQSVDFYRMSFEGIEIFTSFFDSSLSKDLQREIGNINLLIIKIDDKSGIKNYKNLIDQLEPQVVVLLVKETELSLTECIDLIGVQDIKKETNIKIKKTDLNMNNNPIIYYYLTIG